MRVPMIAGNWKMNTTLDEATALVSEMLKGLEKTKGVDKHIHARHSSKQESSIAIM